MSSKRVRYITMAGIVFTVLVIGVSLLLAKISVETRRMELPETAGTSDADSQGKDGVQDAGLERIEVTAETVQDIIATLKRPVSYSRKIRAENYYTDGSAEYIIEVHVLENAKSLKIFGAGQTKNVIITDGMLYVWEEGDRDYYKAALGASEDETRLSDMFQMLLTYEDVLTVTPSSIVHADYGEYGGEMCIVVQYETKLLNYLTTCYISVKNGLLLGAEQHDGQSAVYSMSASDFSTEIPEAALFDLPDGTNALREI